MLDVSDQTELEKFIWKDLNEGGWQLLLVQLIFTLNNFLSFSLEKEATLRLSHAPNVQLPALSLLFVVFSPLIVTFIP